MLIDKLKYHLENTSLEELQKEWKLVKEFGVMKQNSIKERAKLVPLKTKIRLRIVLLYLKLRWKLDKLFKVEYCYCMESYKEYWENEDDKYWESYLDKNI